MVSGCEVKRRRRQQRRLTLEEGSELEDEDVGVRDAEVAGAAVVALDRGGQGGGGEGQGGEGEVAEHGEKVVRWVGFG